jgi:hypothetical protein
MLNIKSMLGADIQYIETWILQSLNLWFPCSKCPIGPTKT